MDFLDTAVVCALIIRHRKYQRKRKYWVHPLISERMNKEEIYFDVRRVKKLPREIFWLFPHECNFI